MLFSLRSFHSNRFIFNMSNGHTPGMKKQVFFMYNNRYIFCRKSITEKRKKKSTNSIFDISCSD